MEKFLPNKKNWFQHLAEGVSDFFWGTRSARMSSETLRINNDNLIEYYEKRDSIQQQIQIAQIQLKTVMEERNFQFQYEQGNLNRQFQAQQGELSRIISQLFVNNAD